jgi:hypothetical protein
MKTMTTIILALLLTAPALCAVHAVPVPNATIQAAVTASLPGDTILVQPGTYLEHDIVLKSGITLLADGGAAVVDAGGLGRCMYSNEHLGDIVIEGFRFTDGVAVHGGALMFIADGVIELIDCEISGCASTERGGGISFSEVAVTPNRHSLNLTRVTVRDCRSDRGGGLFSSGSTLMRGCTFASNVADAYGGSMQLTGQYVHLDDTVVETSSAVMGGGLHLSQSGFSTDGAAIRNNHATSQGGGVYSSFSDLTLVDTDIVGNTADVRAGGIDDQRSTIYCRTSTFSNSTPALPGFVCDGYVTFDCCDVTAETVMCADVDYLDEDCPTPAESATFSDIKRAFR